MTNLHFLERFARRPAPSTACELCASPLAEPHRHVVDIQERRLLCACSACVLLFDGPATHRRYRTVPDSVRFDPGSNLTASDLSSIGVPVGLAFFFRPSTHRQWLAVFPSPAGPTEAELPDEAWEPLLRKHPWLSDLQEDVEALLVHRRRDGRSTALIVPIDTCYELTALVRKYWRGIEGGDEVVKEIDAFVARLLAHAVAMTPRAVEGGRP